MSLGAHIYEPRHTDVRANLLISSALAVPQYFYAAFARHAARRGLRVLTYDYRGVGRSRPAHLGEVDYTLGQWAEQDYAAALRWLLRHHGEQPTHAVGHSFGGQVMGTIAEATQLSSAALVASAVGTSKHFSARSRWTHTVMLRGVLPLAVAGFGYLPGFFGLGHDLPGGVARQWAHWCAAPDYYLSTHPHFASRLDTFRVPTMVVSAQDDAWRAPRNEHWLFKRYEPALVRKVTVGPADVGGREVGHFGFFRESNAALWPRVLDFLDPEAPSGNQEQAA